MKLIIIILTFFISVNSNKIPTFAKINPISNLSLFQLKLFEGQKTSFHGVLIYNHEFSLIEDNVTLNCWMDYKKVGLTVNWIDKIIKTKDLFNYSLEFTVEMIAKRLGGSNLICGLNSQRNSNKLFEQTVAQLVVERIPTIAEFIFRILVSIFVIILTFVMGSSLNRDTIIGYLKRPISPLIGFCSQFIFMPLISACLGKFTGIEKAFGLGLLTIGCSPGGGASNVWTVLFEGDLDLSITMTFISSIAALGMMPFWLFILSRLFIDPNIVQVPYGNIGLNLLQIVIPVGFGIAFRWKWKNAAENLAKKMKMMGLVFVIFILTYGSYANLYVYKLLGDYTYLLPIGAFLPWLGFLFGFLVSVITRRTKAQTIAISLETGFQNIGIALLILKFSMPQPEGDLGSVMPIIVALFTPTPLYFGLLVLFIKKRLLKIKTLKDEVKMDSLMRNKIENNSK